MLLAVKTVKHMYTYMCLKNPCCKHSLTFKNNHTGDFDAFELSRTLKPVSNIDLSDKAAAQPPDSRIQDKCNFWLLVHAVAMCYSYKGRHKNATNSF